MKCQNCGENDANVRYTEVINGKKKEYILCEDCAEKLGINNKMNFNMDIDLGNFFGGFFDDYNQTPTMLDGISKVKQLKCNKCGMTYDEFANTGKFGCDNCYTVFAKRLDGVLKNIQGDTIHIGRKGKKISLNRNNEDKKNNSEVDFKKNSESKLQELKEKLNNAIKEERYEDAAKLRDEIKKQEKQKGGN
jgi:protein arginine kinase activator